MSDPIPTGGPAATQNISFAQALLAPLDAIFKAQIHAARSFLNLLLQIGYPHQPVDAEGHATAPDDGKPYSIAFNYETETNGNKQRHTVEIPALALVPVTPLTVDEATFKFAMRVNALAPHSQMQESESDSLKKETTYNRDKRPWFLVDNPVSVQGTFGPSGPDTSQETSIQVEVKLARVPTPAALEKLLTSLGQNVKTRSDGG